MWQALADPDGTYLWAPPHDAANLNWPDPDRAARYTPAIHLLIYSLGWSDPGLGLRWWYDQGRPAYDDRFTLLNAMLGDDLDLLAAWYWTSPLAARQRVAVDPAWLRALQDRPAWNRYWVGGGDPMHLSEAGGHQTGDWNGNVAAKLFTDQAKVRAVLVLDGYGGWYQHLSRLGASLPAASRSWRVEVLCRPVGSLGVYRQSRSTGRWFAGRHRYHSRGAPQPISDEQATPL